MTVKLITYARIFFPYEKQYKSAVGIAMFMVVRGDKLLKRSFKEIDDYTPMYAAQYCETDAFLAGLEWIQKNIPAIETERLEVVFSGAARTKVKNDIDNADTINGYRRNHILDIIKNFDSVVYSAQGKIYSEDENDMYNLYAFSDKVFEMHYGRDNGFMHQIYDATNPKEIVLVGEPELRWRDGIPTEEWI